MTLKALAIMLHKDHLRLEDVLVKGFEMMDKRFDRIEKILISAREK